MSPLAGDRDGGGRCTGCRFVEVSQTAGFLFLPAERVCSLLSDDMLIVDSELDVFAALLRWLDHDRPGRLGQAAHLLQTAVRLHCVSPECIVTKLEPVDWLFDAAPECLVVINEAMRPVPGVDPGIYLMGASPLPSSSLLSFPLPSPLEVGSPLNQLRSPGERCKLPSPAENKFGAL